MTAEVSDFKRRTRALVSAVGLLQRSHSGSVGYGEFRRKLDKSLRLVLDTAIDRLRAALKAEALHSKEELVRMALDRRLVTGEAAERWLAYFACFPQPEGADYGEEVLALLRQLPGDAFDLEEALAWT